MIELYLRLPNWCRLAWWILLFGILGRVAFANPYSGTVVPIYRNAGLRWLRSESIYTPAPPLDVFRNPPPVAAFFAPWALLPEKPVGLLWRILNLSVYLAGLLAIVQVWESRNGPIDRRNLSFAAFFAALLIIPSFNNGQVNLLLVGCSLLAWANLERGRLWRVSIWIAIATLFKIYPFTLGLLMCLVVPRLTPRLFVCTVVPWLGSLVCQSPGYAWCRYCEFLEFTQMENQYRLLVKRVPWDWTILPDAWMGLTIGEDCRKIISALAGLSFAALIFAKRRHPDSPMFCLNFACIWMTLFGPATENVTYTLLAPIAAMQLLRSMSVASWLVCILLSLPILRGMFPTSETLPFRTAQSLAAIVLMVLTIQQLFAAPFRTTGKTHVAVANTGASV
jgi:Glycosyltransferase family 87